MLYINKYTNIEIQSWVIAPGRKYDGKGRK